MYPRAYGPAQHYVHLFYHDNSIVWRDRVSLSHPFRGKTDDFLAFH